MKLNKSIIIVIFLLSIFAIGTTSFVDTVDAAKWKKFDSGSYTVDNADSGYKKKVSFTSYIKGNTIKMKVYKYKIKNNKKVSDGAMYIIKKGKKFKLQGVDKKGKNEGKPIYITNNIGIKPFYKLVLGKLKNVKSSYLKSKPAGTTSGGSTGVGSGSHLVPRYVPAQMGSVWDSYSQSYTWGVVKQGYWTYDIVDRYGNVISKGY